MIHREYYSYILGMDEEQVLWLPMILLIKWETNEKRMS